MLTAALFLASCSGKDDDEKPGSPDTENSESDTDAETTLTPLTPEPVNVVDIPTTDQPIELLAPATGLAVWDHPTLPYNGLIIAATSEGIYAHAVEGDEAAIIQPNIHARGGALFYLPPGYNNSDAQSGSEKSAGASLNGIFTTLDTEVNALRFFRIDNIDRKFVEDMFSVPVSSLTSNFCISTPLPPSANPATYILTLPDLKITTIVFTQNSGANNNETINLSGNLPNNLTPSQITDCAVDQVDNIFYLLTRNGEVYAVKDGSLSPEPIIRAQTEMASSLQITHNYKKDETSGLQSQQTQMLILDRDNAQIHIHNKADGTRIGVAQLAAFDDRSGVSEADIMAVGSGNYGGLYRFGVIALATIEEQPAVRLSPMLAIARVFDDFSLDGPFAIRQQADKASAEPGKLDGPISLPELDLKELNINLPRQNP